MRENPWLAIGVGLLLAVIGFFEIRDLWPRFSLMEWFMLAFSVVIPPVTLWRYRKATQAGADPKGHVGVSIAMGGYIPLWFAFRLAERVAGG